MAGTKKLDKFELPPAGSQRTTKLAKFELPPSASPIITPTAEPSPATIAASRSSIVPEGTVQVQPAPEPHCSLRVEGPVRSSHPGRAADREPQLEQLRTRLARKFTTLADEVTECFEDFQIGAGAWGAELTAPEGMSTNAGKHASQHLRLRPRRKGHPVLVGGLVDPVAKTAELREYDYVLLQHSQRFGTELGITYDEWEQFLRKAEVVLRMANIVPSRVPPPRELREQGEKRILGLPPRAFALVVLCLFVVLVLFVGWRLLAAVPASG